MPPSFQKYLPANTGILGTDPHSVTSRRLPPYQGEVPIIAFMAGLNGQT